MYFQRRSFKDGGCVEPTVAWALPTGCFLENKGRLKACIQVSDDLSYFRGHSPRYQLNTAGTIVLFDRVSIDVERVLPVDWISDALASSSLNLY